MQVFVDTLFGPELLKRQAEGTLPKPFKIHAAQAVMHPTKETEIRFNDECCFKILVSEKAKEIDRATVNAEQIQNIISSKDDDAEAGHVAMMLLAEGGWYVSFDLRRYRGKSTLHLAGAHEYLLCVEFALRKKLWRAYSENMFAATELISRALIFNVMNDEQVIKGSHRATSSAINFQSKLGNVHNEYVDLHNRYIGQRKDARYVGAEIQLDTQQAKNDYESLKNYYIFARKQFVCVKNT